MHGSKIEHKQINRLLATSIKVFRNMMGNMFDCLSLNY